MPISRRVFLMGLPGLFVQKNYFLPTVPGRVYEQIEAYSYAGTLENEVEKAEKSMKRENKTLHELLDAFTEMTARKPKLGPITAVMFEYTSLWEAGRSTAKRTDSNLPVVEEQTYLWDWFFEPEFLFSRLQMTATHIKNNDMMFKNLIDSYVLTADYEPKESEMQTSYFAYMVLEHSAKARAV